MAAYALLPQATATDGDGGRWRPMARGAGRWRQCRLLRVAGCLLAMYTSVHLWLVLYMTPPSQDDPEVSECVPGTPYWQHISHASLMHLFGVYMTNSHPFQAPWWNADLVAAAAASRVAFEARCSSQRQAVPSVASRSAVGRCLARKRIGIFGDSLLRNIWEALVVELQQLEPTVGFEHEKFGEWHEPGSGERLLACGRQPLEYYWAPSAFHAGPSIHSPWAHVRAADALTFVSERWWDARGENNPLFFDWAAAVRGSGGLAPAQATFGAGRRRCPAARGKNASHEAVLRATDMPLDAFDVIVYHVGVWDMDRPADDVYAQLVTLLHKLRGRTSARLIVLGLHQLWPERCADPHSACALCNHPLLAATMRWGIAQAVECAALASGGVPPIELLDTLAVTNTSAARADGHDAVHFGWNTTVLEARALLAALCADERTSDVDDSLGADALARSSARNPIAPVLPSECASLPAFARDAAVRAQLAACTRAKERLRAAKQESGPTLPAAPHPLPVPLVRGAPSVEAVAVGGTARPGAGAGIW